MNRVAPFPSLLFPSLFSARKKATEYPRGVLATVSMSTLRMFVPEDPVLSCIVLPVLSYPYRVVSSTVVPKSVGCIHRVGHQRVELKSNVGTSKSAQKPQRYREVALRDTIRPVFELVDLSDAQTGTGRFQFSSVQCNGDGKPLVMSQRCTELWCPLSRIRPPACRHRPRYRDRITTPSLSWTVAETISCSINAQVGYRQGYRFDGVRAGS